MKRLSLTTPAGHLALTLVGLLLVSINLRPALTSVSAVLIPLGESLGLDPTAEGVLTTLPVICLGLGAPFAPRMARRIGPERAVLVVLVLLALFLLLRPYAGSIGLFLGTAAAGGCIGIMGVLLPGLVKRDFPGNIGLMTGLYTMALNFGAAVAAGTTEPLRLLFGNAWRPALTFWIAPAILAAVVWAIQLHTAQRPARRKKRSSRLYKSFQAWQVTAFMGLQSSLAYIIFGWLPTILADRGMTAVTAGLALSVSILCQVATSVIVPAFGARMRDQRAVIVVVMLVVLIGIAGSLYGPLATVWLWVIVLGLGQGGAFGMALTLLALRAQDHEIAADLSGMAQGVGYLVAAMGPLAVGLIHDYAGSWAPVGALVGVLGALAIAAALGAGRDFQIAPPAAE